MSSHTISLFSLLFTFTCLVFIFFQIIWKPIFQNFCISADTWLFLDHPSGSLRHCVSYNSYKNDPFQTILYFFCWVPCFLWWNHKNGKRLFTKEYLCLPNILWTKNDRQPKRCAFSNNLYFLKYINLIV